MIRPSLNIHKGILSLLFFISLFTFISLSTCLLLARTSHAQWAATYGGAGGDESEMAWQTTDGGYIVAGEKSSSGAGGGDFWVLKLNSSGSVQWQKTYGGTNDDEAEIIQQTSDGGYIVAGSTESFGAGNEDIWVLKLNSSGNVQWQKTYGGEGDEEGSIWQTSDGGYIVVGETSSFGAGGADIWVLKLDSSGSVQWQNAYGGGSGDDVGIIQQTSDGGYVVSGLTTSFGAGGDDVWVLKLDSSGNIQWQKAYGGTNDDEPFFIQQTSDDGYIVSGVTSSFGSGGNDTWVLKLDSSGNIQWQKTYGGSGGEGGMAWQATDGGYIMAGSTKSFGAGNEDAWVLKLDSNGNVQWQKAYGGVDEDSASNILQTSDGGYIVGGGTESFGAGGTDFWVLKLKSDGTIDSLCDFIQDTNVSGIDSNATVTNTNATVSNTNITPQDTSATVLDTDVTANILCASSQEAPVLDIKANNSDSSITLSTSEQLDITISIDSGSYSGASADWYIAVNTPSGWQSFNVSQMDFSISGISALVQDFGLISFGPAEIFSTSSLSAGTYTYYFVVVPNVVLNEPFYYDSVEVNVTQ